MSGDRASILRDRRVQYETVGLDVHGMAGDPFTQWHRWYDDAEAAGVAEPNAMTVATVRTDGTPDARVVLAREVDERGFAFYTNLASAKGEQLAMNPSAAAVFAWLDLHRQVRLTGRVVRLDDARNDAYFSARPRGSQIGAWASPQSRRIADRAELEVMVAVIEERFAGADVPRPDFWGGFAIQPRAVEFWQGRPSRLHDRLRYTRRARGMWRIDRLAP